MHALWSVHEAWQAIMWGYLAQPSMYTWHVCLATSMPWLFKLSSFNELIMTGRYCLLQRTRFLIDQVSTWRLLQHEAEDSSFKLQEMFSQIDGSPI